MVYAHTPGQLGIGILENPLVIFAVGIALVVFLLVKIKLPAFFGLVISTLIIGLIMPQVPASEVPVELAESFGDTIVGVGIPILMAAIIGKTLMESGAAERIVRSYLDITGEENADIALMGSGFFLAIPVFFASVFYLLAPIARSMRIRTGGHLALYISALGAGAAAAHGLVIPTPGPLAVASELEINYGVGILVGLVIASISTIASGFFYARWIDSRIDVPLRESMGADIDELEEMVDQPESELPSLVEAMLPILLAVVLIVTDTLVSTFGTDANPFLTETIGFLGDPNAALTIAAIAATWTYYRMAPLDLDALSEELSESLKFGGEIIAIVAAGGAFGAMLALSGVGEYVASLLASVGIPLLVTGWLIAALVRVAQGSATVALLTAAGIMVPLLDQLAVHPVYMMMAIGSGGVFFSWYNDGGFWIVSEIGGLSQKETFQTWTAITVIQSVVGLVVTLTMATLLPLS